MLEQDNLKHKLSYKALLNMDGFQVLVHDLEYDAYDQICTVRVIRDTYIDKNFKPITKIVGCELFNDEFIFTFNFLGNCVNGEFEVCSLKENRGDILCL